MKITFLGTAAAECFPAIFCNCKYCQTARKLGGKNIRTRTQTLINNDLLIDYPADSYYHFIKNGIEADTIKNILITHSHIDHLYKEDLFLRHGFYAHNCRSQFLNLYSNEKVISKIKEIASPKSVILNPLNEFQSVEFDGYKVTSFPAKHMLEQGAQFYMIKGDSTFLYAHDTGYFYDEVFDYIRRNKITFDAISFDCTNVDLPSSVDGKHMGIKNIRRVQKRLKLIGAINNNTVIIINHFSHNGNPIQHIVEEKVKKYGWLVAYDGMTVNI